MENKIVYFPAGILIGIIFMLIIYILSYNPRTDLEIYTQDNIYYINGLTVTNEQSDESITFSDMESLKIYISDVTSKVIIYNY